jgi:hypothetical protein
MLAMQFFTFDASRRALARSHGAVVAMVVLLLGSCEALLMALRFIWSAAWPLTAPLLTQVARFFRPELRREDVMAALVAGSPSPSDMANALAMLFALPIFLLAVWLLARWVYGADPVAVLTDTYKQLTRGKDV